MGRRGPPPKPTALRLLQGNPGKRPLNPHEPRTSRALPRAPAWLPEAAKAEWKRVTRILRELGVLTYADVDALAVYCRLFVRWRAAEEFLEKHGEAFPLRDAAGQVRYFQPFPQVATARQLAQLLRCYQQEFGMTPSARSRISLDPPTGRSAFEEFLARKR